MRDTLRDIFIDSSLFYCLLKNDIALLFAESAMSM